MKAFAIAFCIVAIALCIAVHPGPSTLVAITASTLTWIAMDWRYGTIVRAAKAAAHAFCFSDGGLAELRELSKIVLTYRTKPSLNR